VLRSSRDRRVCRSALLLVWRRVGRCARLSGRLVVANGPRHDNMFRYRVRFGAATPGAAAASSIDDGVPKVVMHHTNWEQHAYQRRVRNGDATHRPDEVE